MHLVTIPFLKNLSFQIFLWKSIVSGVCEKDVLEKDVQEKTLENETTKIYFMI